MSMKCLICKKILDFSVRYDGQKPDRTSSLSEGGTVEISFGYGSRYDCQMALGFICDDCFEENKNIFVNHYDGLK